MSFFFSDFINPEDNPDCIILDKVCVESKRCKEVKEVKEMKLRKIRQQIKEIEEDLIQIDKEIDEMKQKKLDKRKDFHRLSIEEFKHKCTSS